MKAKWFTVFALGFTVGLMTFIMGTASIPVQAYPSFNPTPTSGKPPTFPNFPSAVVKTGSLFQSSLETVMLSPSSVGIINGDFESGRTGWVEFSHQGWPLILYKDDLPVTPHSGNWAAWLGGDDNEVAYISQTVGIPTAGTLTLWEWIASEDECGYDFAWVRINNINVTTVNLCSSNNTNGWVKRTVDLGTYAGQTVSLQIRVETDESLNSNYFVDDVALSGSTPPSERYVYLPLVLRNFWAGFFDDFSNPQSGWYVDEDENVIWRYLSGEYQIYLKQKDWWAFSTPDLVLPSDYRIEVEARKVSAGVCAYGLIFGTRYTADSWETYEVLIWPTDREFLVEKRTIDGSWIVLKDWAYSSAINENYGTNRIRIDRIGTSIKVYINGTMVASITDSSFTSPGRDAGVIVYSYWDAPVDVRFDNFRASQP